MLPSKEQLVLQVDEAEWGWLRAHLERGGVIVVAPELDLTEAGQTIAADDSATVAAWIGTGRLAKPTREEISVWDATPEKWFRVLIISPYVLIQETQRETKEVYQ